ncbi:hypothetical protein [Limosilactobacillus reuteri]|uniref:hypothetical protein n=1 Tax=Limosilactobacillus reuteri TaxID=1598 RepID=UPI001C5B4709|nr:hypothetical protein [Limosilactobacillus reuteri]MBW3350599.1 hypothetical protein [Limosilactobacillus reuteri]UUW69642.1 hypothetical protein NUJ10_11425 [Limosilactobacillus reuteri]
MEKNDFKKFARDLYFKKEFSINNVSGQEAMRNAILDALGGEFTTTSWGKHKYDVFELISVAVDAVVPRILTDQFANIADIRTVSLGDKPIFEVKDPRAIRVGRVAAGNQDIRRQTIKDTHYSIETEWFGASVYTELDSFMAGDIDWTDLVNRVAQAFTTHIQTTIAEALNDSYSLLDAADKVTGQASLDQIVKLAERIQVKANQNVALYGTKSALSKVAEMANVNYFSGSMKDELNQNGYLNVVRGLTLHEIPQAFKVNSDEFALDDNKILVLPEGEKIVGVVMEGPSRTIDPDYTTRNDLQMGFKTLEKMGIMALQMKVYGMAELG